MSNPFKDVGISCEECEFCVPCSPGASHQDVCSLFSEEYLVVMEERIHPRPRCVEMKKQLTEQIEKCVRADICHC